MNLTDVVRAETPHVLAALVHRYGDFDLCEDAVQEALLAAARQWPAGGVPDDPRAWLIRVASRRRIELWRNEDARRRREANATADPAPFVSGVDDTLRLYQLCCHPLLPRPARVALTLRAVGGLTTAEIARAFLVPEPTMTRRISRAKQRLRGAGFVPPDRVDAVLDVLFLLFTEGSTASSGGDLHRTDLSAEAIRLARQLHAAHPCDGEVAGLLALMLLTEARRPGRTTSDGALVPLAAQDRTRWDLTAVAEGTALLETALRTAPIGPFQLQAAIAAVHDEAPSVRETDWPQILALYDLLDAHFPGPMVALARVVAVAMVHGADAGLTALDTAAAAPALAGHHRVAAVRAHLLDLAGERAAARDAFHAAAALTLNTRERDYLTTR